MKRRAGIAQLVEQRTENPRARGSSPRPGICSILVNSEVLELKCLIDDDSDRVIFANRPDYEPFTRQIEDVPEFLLVDNLPVLLPIPRKYHPNVEIRKCGESIVNGFEVFWLILNFSTIDSLGFIDDFALHRRG